MRHEKFFENRSMLVVVDMVAAKRRQGLLAQINRQRMPDQTQHTSKKLQKLSIYLTC